MSDPLAMVTRLRDRLPEFGPDGEALSDALERWIGGESFESALGLVWGWRDRDRRARRDELIRELGDLYGGAAHARAVSISRALRSYMAGSWRHQRNLSALPAGEPRRLQLLHGILRLDPDPPTSIRQLISIVSVCNPSPLQLQTEVADGAATDADQDEAA